MFRFRVVAVLVALALFARGQIASAIGITENFSSNPSNTWSYGVGDNGNSQITWNPSVPAYAGDVPGELDVHINSSLPTVRFQRPLGVSLSDTNDFTLTAIPLFILIGDLLLESDTNGGRILLEGGIVTPPTPPPPPPPPTPITPTYETTFSTAPSDWTATDASGVEGGGSFSSSHIDYSQGCLRLTLTGDSTTAGNVGAELVSNATFPYGTYEFSMRAASDCATPSGTGNVYSGSISACFNFMNDSETEIDCPEIQGQSPQRVEFTNWLGSTNNQWTPVDVTYQPHQGFHLYKFIWSASSIEFYIDGALQCTHTVYVPSTSARIIINLWGTNSTDFGGTATSATRYMYINSVKFLAA